MTKKTEIVNSMDVRHMLVQDWIVFPDPKDEDQMWELHVPFLLSNWTCLYGRGCPGNVWLPKSGDGPAVPAGVDVGCCSDGAYITDAEDRDHLAKQVARLTEDDLHKKALDYIKKNGYLVVFNEKDENFNAKTKVRNGACVFANRTHEAAPGDENRIGCAFLHMASRLNRESVDDVDHTETMPKVCWQLPFKTDDTTDEYGEVTTTTIYPWDAGQWTEDGDADFLEYWCVNDSANYSGGEPLYISAKAELTALMGKPAYEVAADLLGKRYEANYVEPMPAAGPNGRTMLPISVV